MGSGVPSAIDVAKEGFTSSATKIIFVNDYVDLSHEAPRSVEVDESVPLHFEGREIEEVDVGGSHALSRQEEASTPRDKRRLQMIRQRLLLKITMS